MRPSHRGESYLEVEPRYSNNVKPILVVLIISEQPTKGSTAQKKRSRLRGSSSTKTSKRLRSVVGGKVGFGSHCGAHTAAAKINRRSKPPGRDHVPRRIRRNRTPDSTDQPLRPLVLAPIREFHHKIAGRSVAKQPAPSKINRRGDLTANRYLTAAINRHSHSKITPIHLSGVAVGPLIPSRTVVTGHVDRGASARAERSSPEVR